MPRRGAAFAGQEAQTQPVRYLHASQLTAEHPNHVRALDFTYDQTTDCPTLKYLNLTDEFTKHALAINVERSMTVDDLVAALEGLIAIHGGPKFVRMDNGTKMTSNAVPEWCRFSPDQVTGSFHY